MHGQKPFLLPGAWQVYLKATWSLERCPHLHIFFASSDERPCAAPLGLASGCFLSSTNPHRSIASTDISAQQNQGTSSRRFCARGFFLRSWVLPPDSIVLPQPLGPLGTVRASWSCTLADDPLSRSFESYQKGTYPMLYLMLFFLVFDHTEPRTAARHPAPLSFFSPCFSLVASKPFRYRGLRTLYPDAAPTTHFFNRLRTLSVATERVCPLALFLSRPSIID
jgi:hypothetical protein